MSTPKIDQLKHVAEIVVPSVLSGAAVGNVFTNVINPILAAVVSVLTIIWLMLKIKNSKKD